MLTRAADTALQLRDAIGWPSILQPRKGFSPDSALADFVERHVGPPATGRRGDEPAAVYVQENGPSLAIGAYGSEQRVRAWLPGLPARISPTTASHLRPIASAFCAHGMQQAPSPADLNSLPVPLLTSRDAGRYLTMGFILAGSQTSGIALSAHRMLVLGPDRLGIWMLRDRKLRQLSQHAHSLGQALPVSINIGVDPSVAIASATSTAALGDMTDKISLAGALAGRPVAICNGETPDAYHLASAEIVLEAHLLPETVAEAAPDAPLGKSMPEFLGYDGTGQTALHVLELSRMHLRHDCLFQAVAGPGREQSVILGLGGALSLAIALRPEPHIYDLRFSHAGGGMLLLFVALGAEWRGDLETLARRMIDICPFIKTIVFVDSDVELSNDEDVFWAITTRSNLPHDCKALTGYAATGMDPSQTQSWLRFGEKAPVAFKSYINATVPPGMREMAGRSFAPAFGLDGETSSRTTRFESERQQGSI